MSQRTPSQRSAIRSTTSVIAWRTSAREASSCTTSGHAGKYGSRPQARTLPLDLDERGRVASEVVGGAAHEVLRMGADPLVVGGDVVGHEVEDEPHAALGELGPSDCESLVAAEMRIDLVASHAVRGPDDVCVDEAGQCALGVATHCGIRRGDAGTFGAALPDAHQPHGVDARSSDVVPHRVGYVGQRDGPTGECREVGQPYPREDLVDHRIRRPRPDQASD